MYKSTHSLIPYMWHLRTCKTNQWGEELDGGGPHGRKEDGPKIGTKGNVLYLVLCKGYICIFTCQNSSSKMPKMYAFYSMLIAP